MTLSRNPWQGRDELHCLQILQELQNVMMKYVNRAKAQGLMVSPRSETVMALSQNAVANDVC